MAETKCGENINQKNKKEHHLVDTQVFTKSWQIERPVKTICHGPKKEGEVVVQRKRSPRKNNQQWA
jgi:hypothetical protein